MPEGSLDLKVGVPARVISVERGDDPLRVHAVNESDLGLGESGSVDRERVNTDVPERDCVDCSLDEHDSVSVVSSVPEEVLADVQALGVEVLRSVSREVTTDNAEDSSRCIAERIRGLSSIGVVPQSIVLCSVTTHSFVPVPQVSSSGVAVQPGLGVDTLLLHLLREPGGHHLVVRLDQYVLTGDPATGPTRIADPDVLDRVHRGAGATVAMHRA